MKWNDKKNISLTFDMQPNEQIIEFFQSIEKESKEQEDAFKERIRQLFDEHIGVEDEKIYNMVLQVFSIGYQCGWNDHYTLIKEKAYPD